jgi:hypothetical protein
MHATTCRPFESGKSLGSFECKGADDADADSDGGFSDDHMHDAQAHGSKKNEYTDLQTSFQHTVHEFSLDFSGHGGSPALVLKVEVLTTCPEILLWPHLRLPLTRLTRVMHGP